MKKFIALALMFMSSMSMANEIEDLMCDIMPQAITLLEVARYDKGYSQELALTLTGQEEANVLFKMQALLVYMESNRGDTMKDYHKQMAKEFPGMCDNYGKTDECAMVNIGAKAIITQKFDGGLTKEKALKQSKHFALNMTDFINKLYSGISREEALKEVPDMCDKVKPVVELTITECVALNVGGAAITNDKFDDGISKEKALRRSEWFMAGDPVPPVFTYFIDRLYAGMTREEALEEVKVLSKKCQ